MTTKIEKDRKGVVRKQRGFGKILINKVKLAIPHHIGLNEPTVILSDSANHLFPTRGKKSEMADDGLNSCILNLRGINGEKGAS